MRILFLNPNATASMTEKVAAAARAAAGPRTVILSATNHAGPPSIQGPADGEAAEPGLLALVREREAEADAFVIACFDDTGLARARALTAKPVIGIGEAAMRAAAAGDRPFSVVTTLSVSVPVIEGNVRAYALEPLCRQVRASEVPVLALEEPGSAAQERVAAEIAAALAEDRPGAVVLGCAGMADLADAFSRRFGLPVLDGVVCAVREAEARHRA
ncbi:aspartate/glutamate racemase family protein [Aureimonas flava]|uniref:Aspartate/glutamate racemase family protein n=1 Tax=Aureimonas flava TaxID=2320271 RepID=A0A3A1WH18_9HYPH|nr:aspartate/glutamate racemase family protein [Aureimonas flava]RIX97976.1 aspartate/glutamate racemase family protein [Aureimonas flava]